MQQFPLNHAIEGKRGEAINLISKKYYKVPFEGLIGSCLQKRVIVGYIANHICTMGTKVYCH